MENKINSIARTDPRYAEQFERGMRLLADAGQLRWTAAEGMAKRARTGDVIEIWTPKGFGYFQYTYKDARWGACIRVLAGLYHERPSPGEIARMSCESERFYTFFPLGAALERGLVKIVGREEVPAGRERPRLWRAPGLRMPGRPPDWWLWDGEREWRIGALDVEQRELPIRAVWTDVLLAEWMANGWTPVDDA